MIRIVCVMPRGLRRCALYEYQEQKPKILTDKGQREFLRVRDRANRLLEEAGAFMMFSALKDVAGDSWLMMAYIDRMVELGEIVEITSHVAGQNRVFVRA
jgi:hypothetical protein